MAKLLNFRCPEHLRKDIEQIGLRLYPVKEPHHKSEKLYDLTATVKHILEVGIKKIEHDSSPVIKSAANQDYERPKIQNSQKIELIARMIDLIEEI